MSWLHETARSTRLAKRSLAASLLLHLIAISSLAAWSATSYAVRPIFAGHSEAIELIVTRTEPQWSAEAITFDATAYDEVPVTIEPTRARIARKHFDQTSVAERSIDFVSRNSVEVLRQIELDVARDRHATTPITDTPPAEAVTPARQRAEPRELRPAMVQLPKSLGTDRTAPSFATSPPPSYPRVAIQNNWEGTVLLRVHVGADGAVNRVEVANSSGYPVLDGAAVNAVSRWSGTPAMQNGLAISTIELLPVRFKLRD